MQTQVKTQTVVIPPVMPKHMDILIRARELIRHKKNWIQGEFYEDGAYCAYGALGEAAVGDPYLLNNYSPQDLPEPWVKAVSILEACIPGEGCYVEEYNDTHSHRSVIRLFDKAIKKASEG